MPKEEKRLLLRARVSALRDRALTLTATFTEPAMKERVGVVVRHLDDELERLEHVADGTPLPRLRQYLPEIVHRIEALERIARAHGPHAHPRELDFGPSRALSSAIPGPRAAQRDRTRVKDS